ncbi:hypothetical protein BaRGS_00020920 [Batillaria attramentaria]|uniref:Uncharacterized protein n=1 Tax=Batillaria attramentaria TaxID=370345 RepID=A0ABD0KLG2_9CAEN
MRSRNQSSILTRNLAQPSSTATAWVVQWSKEGSVSRAPQNQGGHDVHPVQMGHAPEGGFIEISGNFLTSFSPLSKEPAGAISIGTTAAARRREGPRAPVCQACPFPSQTTRDLLGESGKTRETNPRLPKRLFRCEAKRPSEGIRVDTVLHPIDVLLLLNRFSVSLLSAGPFG